MLDILQRIDFSLGPLIATFLLGFATLVLTAWYSSRKQTYWRKLGVPYSEPLPIIGSVIGNFRKNIHENEVEKYQKHGRIYGHYEGNRPLLSVADPDILRDILVKDFQFFTGRRDFSTGDKITENMVSVVRGEDWKRIRTIITPTFTTGKLKRMMNIFIECSETLAKNFKAATDKGEYVDSKRVYGAFTMDVIASSAFSTKIDSHNDPNNKFVQAARIAFSQDFNWRFLLFTIAPWFMKFFKMSVFPPQSTQFFSNVTLQIIEERKRTQKKRNDFLQLLLDTADELNEEGKLDINEKDDITDNYGKDENDQVFKQTAYTKKTLTSDELVANCVIFFIAGYETTAATLSYASYCLALNLDIQDRLIQEVDDALKETNGEMTYEAVQGMKYLDNVISETLRIFSPAIRTERMADEEYKLGDTGITIPKGMIVTIPIYAMHRDPEHFPDPEKFDPDRFTHEERSKRNQYVYSPFGAGPRNCIGMRFALIEIKVCLAQVLRNFRIKTCPQTKVPLEFNYGLSGILQAKEIALKFVPRTDV